MTWVPSKRHFCPVCKVYVPDNPNSRRHHEASGSHKRNMELSVKKAIQKQRDDQREDARVKHEMKKVELEAAKAAEQDRKLFSSRAAHPLSVVTQATAPSSDAKSESADRWVAQRNVHGLVFYKNERTGEMRADKPPNSDSPTTLKPLVTPRPSVVLPQPMPSHKPPPEHLPPTKLESPRDSRRMSIDPDTGLGAWQESSVQETSNILPSTVRARFSFPFKK
jgi:hypothetical protein